MFKRHLAQKILDGEKTQTRRPLSDNPNSPWFKDECKLRPGMDRAIVPGRGVHQVGRVRILGVRKELWKDLSEADALAEGFKPDPNGGWPYTAAQGFDAEIKKMWPKLSWWTAEFWVIEFELVEASGAR